MRKKLCMLADHSRKKSCNNKAWTTRMYRVGLRHVANHHVPELIYNLRHIYYRPTWQLPTLYCSLWYCIYFLCPCLHSIHLNLSSYSLRAMPTHLECCHCLQPLHWIMEESFFDEHRLQHCNSWNCDFRLLPLPVTKTLTLFILNQFKYFVLFSLCIVDMYIFEKHPILQSCKM